METAEEECLYAAVQASKGLGLRPGFPVDTQPVGHKSKLLPLSALYLGQFCAEDNCFIGNISLSWSC